MSIGTRSATSSWILCSFKSPVAMIFALKRSRDNARMLFLSSITYLPLLLILMAVTRR